MQKGLCILALCLAVWAGGCTETRVIRDNSVAAQFSRLDGLNGARVSIGGKQATARTSRASRMDPNDGYYNPAFNPLGRGSWSTNFQVEKPSAENPNSPAVVRTAPPILGQPTPAAPSSPAPTLPGTVLPNMGPQP